MSKQSCGRSLIANLHNFKTCIAFDWIGIFRWQFEDSPDLPFSFCLLIPSAAYIHMNSFTREAGKQSDCQMSLKKKNYNKKKK